MQIAIKNILNKSLVANPQALNLARPSFSKSTNSQPLTRISSLISQRPVYNFCQMDCQTQSTSTKTYAPPRRTGEREAFAGKWLKMKFIDFEIRGKTIENYEMIERTTRRKDTPFDGVATFAILKRDNQPSKLIIIANYRGPVDKYVLEIPAGLMDCPDLVQNAIRELKEETGYVAEEKLLKVSKKESPPTYTDPWRSCSCSKSVFLEVNGNRPENINPQQDLEDAESIFVHLIDIDENITDTLITLAEEHDYIISSNLWCFAQGIQFAKTFKI